MPDVRQMSGVPLPVGDVPVGTVTVRVVRGSLANVVAGHDVELTVGGASRTARTNDAGRAEFGGLQTGARVKAATVVDGERLQSQEFEVPSNGGVRLMLVAAAPGGSAAGGPAASRGEAPAPPQPGRLVLGEQSRIVFEMGDEALTGFYILQLVNLSSAPVQPSTPFTLELPQGAQSPTIMQGSSPQGSIADGKVVVAGPFAPGQTQVQVAFTLPYSSGDLTVTQRFPVPLAQVTLLVQKMAGMQVESAQVSQRREVKAGGDTYILGQGPALEAGAPFAVSLSGLPHKPLWPRNLALALAALILLAGTWASIRPGRAASVHLERRQKLSAKRERLFAELAGVEERHRSGAIDASRYAARRNELVRDLERIYAELDEEAAA
jgi:hypothetical protein